MIDLPNLEMPRDLVSICSFKIKNSYDDINRLEDFILKRKVLTQIVKSNLSEFSDNGNVISILKCLGWRRFRDRIASVYLYKFNYGVYPGKSDLSLINDVIEFEEKYSTTTISSNSRFFLLGIYLKMAGILLDKTSDIYGNELIINNDVYNTLTLVKHKAEKPDWLTLLVWHFIEFVGLQEIASTISTSANPYESITSKLSIDQKKQLYSNMLAYGFSISDDTMFTEIRI